MIERWYELKDSHAAASDARHQDLRLFCVVFRGGPGCSRKDRTCWRLFVGEHAPFDACPPSRGDVYDLTDELDRLFLRCG